jgi:hypothetical protein
VSNILTNIVESNLKQMKRTKDIFMEEEQIPRTEESIDNMKQAMDTAARMWEEMYGTIQIITKDYENK